MDRLNMVTPIVAGREEVAPVRLTILYIEYLQSDYILLTKKLTGDASTISFVTDYAFNLAEGLDKIQEKRDRDGKDYDLILLNVYLPDAVGKSGYQRISKVAPDVPVIVLSEKSNPGLACELINLGVQDFLLKDYITIPALISRSICTAIERKQRIEHGKSLENQLIQAEKLDSLGLIAAGVAHEVKNPLAIIQMAIPYLQGFAGEIDDPNFIAVCEDLEQATEKAIKIIKGMVEFSRDDVIHPVPAQLKKPVIAALNLLSYEIKKSGTTISHQFSDLPFQVCIDESKIEQVVINLVNNAIQAMCSANTHEKEVHISSWLGGLESFQDIPEVVNWLSDSCVTEVGVLEIVDNGPGVCPEKISKIFNPFFTTKAKGKGTGLGLSVVMKIIGLHDALIKVSNREDKSGFKTSIYFKALPNNPKSETDQPGAETIESWTKKRY